MTKKTFITMESLDLPKELYWDFKLEPASPPLAAAGELFALEDSAVSTFLYDDNFVNDITLMGIDEADSLQEAVSMDLISGEDLVVEFLDLKDEDCLLDQKETHYIEYETANFPQQLDMVSQAVFPITKVPVAASAADLQIGDSSLILQQLTPPQSPPQYDGYQQQQKLGFVKEESKLQPYVTDAAAPLTTSAAYSFNNWPAGSDIDRVSQLVDDIVNMRAQELQLPTNWQQYNDDCDSQASSSLGSSGVSDESGTGSSIADDVDEEWLPESSNCSPAHTINEEQLSHGSSATAKKHTRPYGRGVEDRKIRKKEQNKNAATRYRQKKKIEMEHVLGEEQELEKENEELRRTLTDRRHEMRYLRQLIREFYQERKH